MDFLKQKWSYWFTTLDVDHDGMITRDDVEMTLKNFPIIEHLPQLEGKIADDKIEKWWNEYILKGRSKVTEKDLLRDLEDEYTKDRTEFITRMRKMSEEIGEILDTDKDKEMSVDHYVKAYKVWGHDNEALLRKAFEMFKPSHGMIPLQEMVEDWVIFLTNPDPKKKDVVYETYKAGLV